MDKKLHIFKEINQILNDKKMNTENKILEIKSSNMSRVISIENNRIRTDKITGIDSNTIHIGSNSSEFELCFENKDEVEILTAADFKVVKFNQNESDVQESENKLEIRLENNKDPGLILNLIIFADNQTGAIYKQIEVINESQNPLNLLEIRIEHLNFISKWERGGHGQPIFTPGFYWGIEWPSAENHYDGKTIRLAHYPDCKINPKDKYISKKAFVGACNVDTEKVSFMHFIDQRALRKPGEVIRYYSTWSAHDELSSNIYLTEKMSRNLVGIFKKWRDNYGISIDYFLTDCIWFEPTREDVYMNWYKKYWPSPEEFYKDLKDAGLKHGIWIDTSGFESIGRMYPGIIDDALEQVYRVYGPMGFLAKNKIMRFLLRTFFRLFGHRKGTIPCLIDGDYAEKIREAICFHMKNNGVEVLKLDFSRFRCNNPYHNHKPGIYAEERTIEILLDILREASEINPALKAIAYNGYTKHQGYIEQPTVLRNDYAVSPFWALFVNSVYVGDPRVSEIPSPTIRSSIACYTDTQIRLFRDSLLPFRCLDDHGVLMGNTPAIFYIGSKDWRDAWFLDIFGRGTLNYFYHGDLSLIDNDADMKFLKETQRFLDENTQICGNPILIGGNPDTGDIYGTHLKDSEKDMDFIVLHNPGFLSRTFNIPIHDADKKTIMRLYPYGNTEKTKESSEVKLGPAELALFQIGGTEPLYSFEETVSYKDGKELEIFDWDYKRKGNRRITKGIIQLSSPIMLESANQPKNVKNVLFVSVKFKQSIYPWRIFDDPKKQLLFTAKLNNKSLDFKTSPEKAFMGGTSWVVYEINADQILNDGTESNLITFELEYPWDRLVKAEINAYLLQPGNRYL